LIRDSSAMKILFAVWEIAPFFRFGGLGAVARTLPAALKELGVDIRAIIPYYKAVRLGNVKRNHAGKLKVTYDGKQTKVEIYQIFHPFNKFPVYFLKNEKYLDIARGIDTFAFYDKAVVEIIKQNILDFVPDIIHCNDNHAGFIPLLVKEAKLPIKTILTIHNLAYQGKTSEDILNKLNLHNKGKLFLWEIKSRQINMLMEGIIHADIITTVSPTYAKEIMTEEEGYGLEDVLRGKEGRVFGVLNGIDINKNHLKKLHMDATAREDIAAFAKKKSENKLHLQKKLGLKVSERIPLSCFIGRIDPMQKGLDILHKMLRRIDLSHRQFVILGAGDHDWEERFQWLAKFYPKNVFCSFKFDEKLAYRLYAASDFILIPSKFEPCGLIQMMAMYFGTIPIAHRTGGLIDSIKNEVNGFLFDRYSSEVLENTYNKAVEIWYHDKTKMHEMMRQAISADFSWAKSAREYLNLYQKLVSGEL